MSSKQAQASAGAQAQASAGAPGAGALQAAAQAPGTAELPRFLATAHRHLSIEAVDEAIPEEWRMRQRMKTLAVALVLCLNVGVDPPDVIRTNPCAKLEVWTDPFQIANNKCLETLGNALQAQYERWQSKVRACWSA